MIGLANFQRQWARSRQSYLESLERVGQSGWLVLGNEVARFESELAEYWGMRHAVGCASGLDAIEIALRCLGIRPHDVVLTTPLSAFATTLAILRSGAVPLFADVDASGQLDFGDAELAISAAGVKPRFIVPVHLYGHALNLDELESFARRHELIVVEDCAQAIGARSGARAVGSVSRVFATSFYPTKNLGALGDGGALLTDDDQVCNQARCLRDYGQSEKYVHAEIGLNSRLDEIQAAFLRSVQLPALSEQTMRRTAIAQRYRDEIRHPSIHHVPPPLRSSSAWHLFPVLVDDREALSSHLKQKGVASAVHYPRLIPDQPAMRQVHWEPHGRSFQCALDFATRELSLPLHPFLTDAEVETVITACNNWERK